jgi:uncharacterized protein YmfQ (DUF2313 family)
VLPLPSVDTSIISDTLLAYQPDYYKNSKVMNQINTTNSAELTLCNNRVTTTYNNLFIDTADSDTISRWEKIFNLTVAPEDDMSYRRSRIISRIKGQGTFTVAFVKNVAESFENGEVDIIEDNGNYAFTVKFVGTKGVPPNLDDLKDVIEELKPAHLAVVYEFTYLSWSEHDNYNKAWEDWDNLNLTWSEFEVYKG